MSTGKLRIRLRGKKTNRPKTAKQPPASGSQKNERERCLQNCALRFKNFMERIAQLFETHTHNGSAQAQLYLQGLLSELAAKNMWRMEERISDRLWHRSDGSLSFKSVVGGSGLRQCG
jgi:hypothetical protein